MYEILEHEADVGVRGWGQTWEEAFESAAKGMFSVMTDVNRISPENNFDIKVDGKDIETLFVGFLNELLYMKDVEENLFSEFDVKIEKNEKYRLKGQVKGEEIKPGKHELETEVKAATNFGLKSGEKDGKKYVQCILDV